jgi:spermidine synthase
MPRRPLTGLSAALVLSGAAALIYETAWTRQLGLLMGHTVAAASCVLAAFMLGLALGAAIGGRVAVRVIPAEALRVYAVLEIAIAVLALLLPLEFAALRPFLSWAYDDGAGAAFGVVRFISALTVVTVPAVAMGATLPLVVRWAAGPAAGAARTTARLYAWNAFGATAGAIASGFMLLPALGLRRTTAIAVALNLIAAGMAWRLSRTSPVPATAAVVPAGPLRARPNGIPAPVPITRAWMTAIFAIALSGAASLILQIVWTRLLALVVGPTTYAFSMMAATFIAGIAIGSLAGGWLGRRGPAPELLAASMSFCGLAALAAAAFAPHLSLVVADRAAGLDSSFASVMWMQLLLIAATLLPMTLTFGVAFPLAVGLVVRDDRPIAAGVAAVYAANTVGAIAGALAAGFVLVPRFGLQGSVRVAAVLVLGGSLAVVMTMGAGIRRAAIVAIAGAAILGMWFMPSYDRAILSSGAYKYAPYLPDEFRSVLLRAGTLLYYREGAASTVSVRRVAGSVSLAIDGKIDASNAGDMLTQRLLAHLPLLLHPNPRRVAIIGLGSGVTLASALTHPIERVDTIEISREVIEASEQFAHENRGALAERRSRLIVGDGRSHMMLGRSEYDVVISEPSNPWIAGVAGLFTREMFEAIRDRLAPAGIVCQWAHAYDMSDADLRSIAGTFADVFPFAMLWPVGESDVLLVGSKESIESRLPLMRSAWHRAGVSADLAGVHVSGPDVLLSFAAADERGLRSFAAGAPIQRDDRLALEFSGPRSIFGRGPETGIAALRALVAQQSSFGQAREVRLSETDHRDRGLMLFGAEAFDSAVPELLEAVDRGSADAETIDALITAGAAVGKIEEVERHLRSASARGGGNNAAAVGLSRILASRGEHQEAAAVILPRVEAKADAALLEQLASVYADTSDPGRLSAVVAGLRSLAPAGEPAIYFSAVLELMAGRPHDVLRIFGEPSERGAMRARDRTVEAAAYAALGRKDDARRAFAAAIAAEPRNITGYENLATFEAQSGNDRAAAALFAEALILDRTSRVAREGLAAALRRMR